MASHVLVKALVNGQKATLAELREFCAELIANVAIDATLVNIR